MFQGSIYDLIASTPHEPDDARFTAAEFALYRAGYEFALETALRTLAAAERRFELIDRTKRLETRRAHGEATATTKRR